MVCTEKIAILYNTTSIWYVTLANIFQVLDLLNDIITWLSFK